MRDFTGISAHYLKQRTQTAMAALRPLQKLDPDSERQGLEAVIEECSARLLALPVAPGMTVGDALSAGHSVTIAAADVGEMKEGI